MLGKRLRQKIIAPGEDRVVAIIGKGARRDRDDPEPRAGGAFAQVSRD